MRAAGYQGSEVDQALFEGPLLTPSDLLEFQQIKPQSTGMNTIQAIAREIPQQPPLYFLLCRTWMQLFGSSVMVFRSLSAILSLVALGLMYNLAMELFEVPLVAGLATALVAVSPLDVLYAQVAGPYSLLAVGVIGSSWLLLRSLRSPTWVNWGVYSLAIALGLYTHLLFGLTLVAHGVYVLGLGLSTSPERDWDVRGFPSIWPFLGAMVEALLLFGPWLSVMVNHFPQLLASLAWVGEGVGVGREWVFLIRSWVLSFTALFFDLDVGLDAPLTYAPRGLLLVLVAIAGYHVCRFTSRSTWLFLFTGVTVPFLLLVGLDSLAGLGNSVASPYFAPCYPAIYLVVAYWFAIQFSQGRWFWRLVFATMVTGSIISLSISSVSSGWWTAGESVTNPAIAQWIQREPQPLVTTDLEGNKNITGEVLSLSYRLGDRTQFVFLGAAPDLTRLPPDRTPLLFRPSPRLIQSFQQAGWTLKPILLESASKEQVLWKARRPNEN